jgi:tetratricopeptide (TPR) repeat protein
VSKHAAGAFLLCLASALPAQTVSGASLPPSVSEVLQQALGDFRQGKFDAAIEKYQAVLQRDAASGVAYAGLARTYLKQDKVQDAFDTAYKGVPTVPASLPVHTVLGEVYFRQARMVEAEKEFLVGVNAAQPDARACLGLSRLYEAYSLHARAAKMLERAHQIDPDDPEIQRRWLYTLRIREQIEWLEKYLATPNNEDQRRIRSLHTRLEILKDRLQEPRPNCRLVSKPTSTETPLKPLLTDPTHIHGYGLMVQVNGQSSKLLLDTGAGGLLINKKLAQRAGIEAVSASKFGGIGDKGDASGFVGYAKSIKIGDLEFQNCMVEVSDKRSVVDDDGLIGTDVFSHYLVTLDFLWQKMKLEELPQRPGEKAVPAALASHEKDAAEDEETPSPDQKKAGDAAAPAPTSSGPQDRYVAPEMQNYTKIFRIGHSLLLPTRVGDAPPKLFIIDTGATMNTISTQAAREVTKVHGDEHMHVRGVSGSVKDVFSADKAVLQFSHYRQENQEMVAFDLSNISRSLGTEVSGLLGFATLRHFTLKIDYRDGLVDFIYTGPKK